VHTQAIRIGVRLANGFRDLALFNGAIDSNLRGCDLGALRVRDVAHGGTVAHCAIVLQHKTQQPVQFELTDQTRESVAAPGSPTPSSGPRDFRSRAECTSRRT
jgi:hypothetical protein